MWCYEISKMKPGECIEVDMRDLMDIPSFAHNGATFTPADRILENIMGSAYTHSYRVGPSGRTVVFMRHEDTGERRYQSPDRR